MIIFWGDKDVLELDSGGGFNVTRLDTAELSTSWGWFSVVQTLPQLEETLANMSTEDSPVDPTELSGDSTLGGVSPALGLPSCGCTQLCLNYVTPQSKGFRMTRGELASVSFPGVTSQYHLHFPGWWPSKPEADDFIHRRK